MWRVRDEVLSVERLSHVLPFICCDLTALLALLKVNHMPKFLQEQALVIKELLLYQELSNSLNILSLILACACKPPTILQFIMLLN